MISSVRAFVTHEVFCLRDKSVTKVYSRGSQVPSSIPKADLCNPKTAICILQGTIDYFTQSACLRRTREIDRLSSTRGSHTMHTCGM